MSPGSLAFGGFTGTTVLASEDVLTCAKCRRRIGKIHKCYYYVGHRFVCRRCHGRNFRRSRRGTSR